MSSITAIQPLMNANFRANPHYRLVLFDRLPHSQREQLRSLVDEHSFYGVLVDAESATEVIKVVDQDTALLFLTMMEPGPLPEYVRRQFGYRSNEAIAELILEGVLEIASSGTSGFVSGGSAHEFIFGAGTSSLDPGNRIAQLSYDALCYAATLPISSSSALALRMYRYNTIPNSPAWRMSWNRDQTVAHWLGIQRRGSAFARPNKFWQGAKVPEDDGWLTFYSKSYHGNGYGHVHFPFKLYISPLPECLPEVWPAILDRLTRSNAQAFKIGNSLEMILRPDKIVAYLSDFAALSATADELQKELDGCTAQGVPFTAPIDRRGLLSWGTDPDDIVTTNGNRNRESWRSWITEQLASAILAAKSSFGNVDPLNFALDRISLLGVDTVTWTIKQSMWRNAGRTYANSS